MELLLDIVQMILGLTTVILLCKLVREEKKE